MAKVAQERVLKAEHHAAVIDRARAELELEKQRISQLIDILSDFSTQATFLAGCAIAAVSGESLESIEDSSSVAIFIGQGLFVLTSGAAVASSIWVIFIASHLVSLTRDAALRPKIRKRLEALEEGVRDVRGMLWLSLASLFFSTIIMAWLNASKVNASIFTTAMVTIAWQALLKQDLVNKTFQERCGVQETGSLTLAEFWRRWAEPWSRSVLCCSCWRRQPGSDAGESRVDGGRPEQFRGWSRLTEEIDDGDALKR